MLSLTLIKLISKPSSWAYFLASSINARRLLPSAFSSYLLSTCITGYGLLYSLTAALLLVNLYSFSNDLRPLPPSYLGRYISSVDPKGYLPQLWTITFLTSLSSLYVSRVFLKHISDTALNAPSTTDTAVTLFSLNKFPISSQIRQVNTSQVFTFLCVFLMHFQG